MASNNIDKKLADDVALVQQWLQDSSLQPLLEHHRLTVRDDRLETLAGELLTLTQGVNRDADPVAYLSQHTENPNGNRDYEHALSLGHWLGSLQIATDELAFDGKESSLWFDKYLDSLQLVSDKRSTDAYRELSRDIRDGRLSLNEALELLAFGKVTSSSITTVIGQGIRAVERRTQP